MKSEPKIMKPARASERDNKKKNKPTMIIKMGAAKTIQ
jgi:hypothetical protein